MLQISHEEVLTVTRMLGINAFVSCSARKVLDREHDGTFLPNYTKVGARVRIGIRDICQGSKL